MQIIDWSYINRHTVSYPLCYEPCAQIEFPALYCPELDKLLQFFKYFFPQAVLNFQELSVLLN